MSLALIIEFSGMADIVALSNILFIVNAYNNNNNNKISGFVVIRGPLCRN